MRPRALTVRLLGLTLLAALAAGCQRAGDGQGEGPGHRTQWLGLTPEQEYALGQQAYREILSKSEVVRGGPQVEQVTRVGQRIARAAENKDLQREINLHLAGYRFDWEFHVLRDRQVNAFCLPGGKIGVYTGLLELTQGDDDMLATVLSHEVAHALAHHANERVTREQLRHQAIETGRGGRGEEDPQRHQSLLEILMGTFQGLAFDRQQESEADHIGLFLMTFAGYDPRKAVAFWERMAEAGAGRSRPPEILSTHPSDAHRIAQMREWVPQALAAKKAFDEGRVARP
jgi:predicted Zn-dependent protease